MCKLLFVFNFDVIYEQSKYTNTALYKFIFFKAFFLSSFLLGFILATIVVVMWLKTTKDTKPFSSKNQTKSIVNTLHRLKSRKNLINTHLMRIQIYTQSKMCLRYICCTQLCMTTERLHKLWLFCDWLLLVPRDCDLFRNSLRTFDVLKSVEWQNRNVFSA